MPEYHFGPGEAWGTRTDTTGDKIGPRIFGVLQEVSINFDWTNKGLYGQYQFPVVVARGQAKVTWTAKYGRFDGRLFSDIFFGVTPVTGELEVAQQEPSLTTPATPAYTIPGTPFTVTVANAAQFVADLGVIFVSGTTNNGQNGLYRTGAPTELFDYQVNPATGVYTFFSADAGHGVQISYQYNNTATGLKLTVTNQLLGYTPTFRLVTNQAISPGSNSGNTGQPFSVQLNAAVSNKLGLPTRLDDFELQNISGEAYADNTGTVAILSTSEGP